MSNPRLSILIATMGRRQEKFERLLKELMPQVDKYTGEIEVIAYWNNGEKSIAEYRQRLLEAARGDYICYVDDDDRLPEYYCDEIMQALGEDYVGFRVRVFSNGMDRPTAYHSIKYSTWSQDSDGYYRGVTHLNPVRREIALQGSFGNLEFGGEDQRWATEVTRLVKTENYIDKDMYYYYHETEDTAFGASKDPAELDKVAERKAQTFTRPKLNYKYLKFYEETS